MFAQDAVFLRPRGIGELFDQAIRLYRKHFIKFIGIIAIAEIPIAIVRLIVNFIAYGAITDRGNIESPVTVFAQSSAQSIPTLIMSLLSFILVTGVANAALTTAILKSYMGEEISIEDAYRHIRGRWLSLLGALILVGLFNIPLLIWWIIPCVGWITGMGILFFLNFILTPLIAPIIIVERRPAGQALRRAWDLTRRRFWWICGFFILLFLFNLLVVTGPVSVLNVVLLGQMQRWVTADNLALMVSYQFAAEAIMTLVMGLLYMPLSGACATLAYFDLRVRQEGLDLAMMANEISDAPLATSEVASQSPALETSSIITWKEMGFFAAISLGAVALYIIPVMLISMVLVALSPGLN